MQAYDNTSTISDTLGNLLFYTNGVKAWGKNHQQMPNGNNLGATLSSGQSVLIVPQPLSTKYYIFTVGNISNDAFRYSIVDMSLNNGNGNVTTKANILLNGSTEKIDATYNSNDTSYWVLTHQWNSNSYYCYKVNSQGLQTTPVISAIGSTHSGGNPNGYNAMGQMSFSKDGTKLATMIYDAGIIELFDFNSSTGQLSNVITLTGFSKPWGVAYSLNNRYLYYTEWYDDKIIQLDLISGNPSTIIASKTVVGTATFTNTSGGYRIGYLEYGPDSVLYAAKFYQHYLSAITHPNQAGLSCGFVDNAVFLSTKTCDAGLSRTVSSYGWLSNCSNSFYDTIAVCANDSILIAGKYYSPPNNIQDTLTDINGCDSISNINLISKPIPQIDLGKDTSFCDGDSIIITASPNYTTYLWNTGDTQNSISITSGGQYWVQITNDNCSNSDTIYITNRSHSYTHINDTTICEDEKWYISLTNQDKYLWSNGSTSPSISISDSGWYWVQIEDICKTYIDTFHLATIDCNCMMAVPNVFTPNADGLNDLFYPVISCEFDEYHLVIFNRWGKLLFESFDQNEKWNGKYQNSEAPDGVYFYLITYKHSPSSDMERHRSGSITIFR
jgi:gliding motility-associated-like protein